MLPSPVRQCARVGCQNPVKKPTNKYCSRACCAVDPERNKRLREASLRRVVPMSRQLDLSLGAAEEGALEPAYSEREGMPIGLRRLSAG